MESETQKTKFCSHCASQISSDAVICPNCGCQVEQIKGQQETPQIVINNSNTNTNTNVNKNVNGASNARAVNKKVSLLLCIFLGWCGAHKFYEGKIGMGILYLCTGGLCGVGWIIDIFSIIAKPNPYYVN